MLKAHVMILLAESFGFNQQPSPCLGTYLTREDGSTLTIQESGSFSLTTPKGYGECNARPEYARNHHVSTVEYGRRVLQKTLREYFGESAQ